MSMVLRQIGKGKEHLNGLINYFYCMMILKNKKNKKIVIAFVAEPSEKVANIKESVERAKEAVQCDVKDGTSWCKHVFLIHCISLLVTFKELHPIFLGKFTNLRIILYSSYTWQGRIPSSSVHLVDQKITDPLYKVVIYRNNNKQQDVENHPSMN